MYMANVIKTLTNVQPKTIYRLWSNPSLTTNFLTQGYLILHHLYNLNLVKHLKLITTLTHYPRMNKMFCSPTKQPQQAFWNHT